METAESLFRAGAPRVESTLSQERPKLQRRTGKYSTIIPERCNHYAEFMNHLSREQCDAIFWLLLLTIILLLGAVAYLTQRAHRLSQLEPDEEMGLDSETIDHKNLRMRKKLFIVSIVCFLLAVTATVMGAFAGLAISWCYGEDLINFYWSFWTIVDNGCVIAIFGTVLQQWYSLSSEGIAQPPWNFALGTPIPVMATIMHCLGFKSKKAWRSYREKRRENKRLKMEMRDGKTLPFSRSTTVTAETSAKISLSTAKFLTFTQDGKCVLEFEMTPDMLQNIPYPHPYQSSPHPSASSSRPEYNQIEPDTPRYFPSASGAAQNSRFIYPRYEHEYPTMTMNSRGAHSSSEEGLEHTRFALPEFRREDGVSNQEEDRERSRRERGRRRESESEDERTMTYESSGPHLHHSQPPQALDNIESFSRTSTSTQDHRSRAASSPPRSSSSSRAIRQSTPHTAQATSQYLNSRARSKSRPRNHSGAGAMK